MVDVLFEEWDDVVLVCFAECIVQLGAGHGDVGEVRFSSCYRGASDDEAQVSVRWDDSTWISFGEEAVFSLLDIISEATTELAG